MHDIDFFYKPCEVLKPSKHPSPEKTNVGSILFFHEQKWPAGTQVSFQHGKESYYLQKVDKTTWVWKTDAGDWQTIKASSLKELITKLFKGD